MTNTIESQLAALKPTSRPALARRILEIPYRRRQRRRDCFVGFGGLLTGIAVTVLVMLLPLAETVEPIPVVVYVPVVQEVVVSQKPLSHLGSEEGTQNRLLRAFVPLCETNTPDPLDLDVWIARYERLLRHRQVTSRTVYVPPVTAPVLPDGMSPLEYRQTLLTELGG